MEGPQIEAEALAIELADLLDAGRGFRAVARCREVFASGVEDHRILRLLASTLMEECEPADAALALARLAQLAPSDAQTWIDLSEARQRAGDLTGAEAAADAVLASDPQHPIGAALRAEALYLQGRYREAFEFLAPMARAPGAHLAILPIFGRLCKVEKKPWQGISPLEQALAAPHDAPRIALVEANFVLADLYNSARRYEQAWEVVTRANALKGAEFDPEAFESRIDAAIAAWNPSSVCELPEADAGAVQPILIVGMPRSGTTLVEQILANHPRVAGGGELATITRLVINLSRGHAGQPPLLEGPDALTPEWVQLASRRYADALAAVAEADPGEITRVTDKMPINALHLGLVQAIAPRSKVLWVRRNALDTSISCYFQNFGGANSYAYDLEHLGRFHRALERLVLHLEDVLRLDILHVPYESLVGDLPGWTRRILDFVGLPWEESCLRFHESTNAALTLSNAQVRVPLFTSSIGRWKPYAQYLEPLADALHIPHDQLSDL
ncbi:MAG: sulfotransferase [Phycisphaerales bacterium]|nr:sulfotransferase [Phycisphaerales bacterium]